MYDSGKIIAGLVVFLGLFASPFWYDALSGSALHKPEIVLPSAPNAKECVASTAYMRRDHMILLNEWRTEVVREGKTYYTSDTGKIYKMRLARTCLTCHSNASQFCDRCHSYVGVNPYCWECHNETGPHGQGATAAEILRPKSEILNGRHVPSRTSTLSNAGRDRRQTKTSGPS